MNKLINCGCGGEAFHDTTRGWNPVREDALVVWHRVICKNCGTQTKVFYTEAEAIEAWNKAMGERIAKVENIEDPAGMGAYGDCSECGVEVTEQYAYCPNCGVRLEWE